MHFFFFFLWLYKETTTAKENRSVRSPVGNIQRCLDNVVG